MKSIKSLGIGLVSAIILFFGYASVVGNQSIAHAKSSSLLPVVVSKNVDATQFMLD